MRSTRGSASLFFPFFPFCFLFCFLFRAQSWSWSSLCVRASRGLTTDWVGIRLQNNPYLSFCNPACHHIYPSIRPLSILLVAIATTTAAHLSIYHHFGSAALQRAAAVGSGMLWHA
ncbi:uncharacterized protein BKA78DRAFT_56963 [Phyllosticta capitalensis]|uniref:Secreted protein n=1 Tax=Phyllosticta capitalensis TaxID=121624 RepID=A0ABR1YE58_9PEZI